MRGDALSPRGAVLEAVPRSAADEPDALLSGEAVDQIIAVRAILILADAAAEQRGVCEAGEAPRDIGPRFGDAGGGELAFERVGVDRRAVRVEGDLESRAFEIGDAIDDSAVVEIGPYRPLGRGEARVTLRRASMIDLLPRRDDPSHQLQIGRARLNSSH